MADQPAPERHSQAAQAPTHPPPPSPSEIPIENRNTNSHANANDHVGSTQGGQQVETQPVKIIIQEDNSKSIHDVITSVIGIAGFLVAAAVFIITLLLFQKTVEANQTTTTALRHQIEKDSIDAIAKAEQDSVDRQERKKNDSTRKDEGLRDRQRFELQRTSTQAQIDALIANETNFRIQNQPYLQIDAIRFDTLAIGKNLVLTIRMKNFGIYPVKILEAKMKTVSRFNVPDFNDIYAIKSELIYAINIYITKETPYEFYSTEPEQLTASRYNKLLNGSYFFYLFGYFKYQNLVSQKISTYKFIIKKDFLRAADSFDHLLAENK